MSNPLSQSDLLSQIVTARYAEFNSVYTAAREESSAEGLSRLIFQLEGLKNEIEENVGFGGALPNKVSSLEFLSKDLAARIQGIVEKENKRKEGSSAFGDVCVKGYVGFCNTWANCWANSMLQILLNTPEHRAILTTVGEFYAQGGNFDKSNADAVIDQFLKGTISEESLKSGSALFRAIESPVCKLRVLKALLSREVLVQRLIPLLSQELRSDFDELYKLEVPLKQAIDMLIDSKLEAEKSKEKNAIDCGKAFLQAIEMYDKCRASKQPVPASVSHNIRLAFHFLYGDSFSFSDNEHQDLHEAFGCLLRSYESILKVVNKFPPKTHALLESRRFYKTDEASHPRPLSSNNRTRIEEASAPKRSYEYQIVINVVETDPAGITVESLMSDRFFKVEGAGSEKAIFLRPDGREQEFAIERDERSFIGPQAPSVLSLVIIRNFYKDGEASKITIPVSANRVITIPANGTSRNVPLAYELESFAAHVPLSKNGADQGHYIAYRKIDEDWVEFNDGFVRVVGKAELDTILHGSTPYVLNYRLVPQAKQAEMLRLSLALRKVDEAPEQQKIIDLLKQLQKALRNESITRAEVMSLFFQLKKINPQIIKEIATIISIEDKVEFQVAVKGLSADPRRIARSSIGWVRAGSGNLIDQLLKRENEKFAARKTSSSEVDIQSLSAYLELLNNLKLTNEQLVGVFKLMDIPEAVKRDVFIRIAKVLGHPSDLALAKIEFEKNPRILIERQSSAADDFFESLLLDRPSKTILEDVINSLQK